MIGGLTGLTNTWIEIYIVNGQVYAPPQECKIYKCGVCDYDLVFESDSFKKEFPGNFSGLIEVAPYTLKITPNVVMEFSKENSTPFTPIGVSIYTPKDICDYEHNFSNYSINISYME